MLNTYLFIPADKERFLSNMKEISSDYFVLDFEDAVSYNNKLKALENVKNITIDKNVFFRIPIIEESGYTKSQLLELIELCEGRVVLPKINSRIDVENIIRKAAPLELKIVILVETPSGYRNIRDILEVYNENILAIGFGSHDFCSIMGMRHELEYLKHYKFEINAIAKSFNKEFLDGVDLDIINFENFQNECYFAFNMGADGKFLIHPKQVDVAKSLSYISSAEMTALRKVYEQIKDIAYDDIDVITIDGLIYEKPHISRIKRIFSKLK